MLATLLHRDFGLVWLAGLISLAGDYALLVALPLHVYRQTDSTLATAGTLAAGFRTPSPRAPRTASDRGSRLGRHARRRYGGIAGLPQRMGRRWASRWGQGPRRAPGKTAARIRRLRACDGGQRLA